MELLIIRHAIAEDAVEHARRGRGDDERALTAKGVERMRQGAAGLRRLVPRIDVLATSPLRRARQTAVIVQDALDAPKPAVRDELAPGAAPAALAEWLAFLPADGVVAVVGHEPQLSELVGWLTTGEARSTVELRKGAACLLEISGRPEPGGAVLRWLLTPKQLRLLATD
jgi:phosphohistidine phosphatase